MDKKKLLQFLEPYDDDQKVVIRGANKDLMSPVSYTLGFEPANEYHSGIVFIAIDSCAAVDTGVSG